MALTPRLAILLDASGTKALGEFKKVESASKALEEQSKKTAAANEAALASPTAKNTGKAAAADTALIGKQAEASAAQTALLGKAALVTGGAMLAGFGLAERSAMQFDKAMSAVNATSDLTSKQFADLRNAALTTGQQFGISATTAATAEQQLLKTGLSVSDVLGGGLKNALALATAGSLDVGDAAKIAAQAMNAFGLSGGDFGHVADVLASGANKSASTVAGLGDAISQVAPSARLAGLSLDQTVGVLDMFAQKGTDAGDAGTTFRQFLLKLTPTGAAAKKEMALLGLNMYDARGQFIGLGAAADLLHTKFGGLSQQQQLTALTTIFGARAAKSAIPFVLEGSKAIDAATLAVSGQGSAADLAAKKLDNLSGDIHKLGAAINTDLIKSTGGATGGLRILVSGVTGAINEIGNAPKPVQETIGVLAGLGGAALTVGGTVAVLAPKIAAARTSLEAMGGAGRLASAGLGQLGTVVGLGATVLTLAALYEHVAKIGAQAHDINKLSVALQDLALNSNVSGELAKFGSNVDDIVKKLATGTTSPGLLKDIENFANITQPLGAQNKGKQALDDFSKSMAQLVTSGHAAEATTIIKALGEAAARQGLDFGTITGKMTSYNDAVKAADLAAQGAKSGTAGLTAAQQALNLTIDAGGNAVDGLGQKYDSAGQKILSMSDQVDKLSTAIDNQIKAQHSYDQALRQIQTAKDNATDAQGRLDKLNRDGAQDEKAIAAATLTHEKAVKAVTDANEQLTKAQTALTKAQIPSTALELLDAQNKITESAIRARSAQEALTEAIKKRDELQAQIAAGSDFGRADNIAIAQQNVTDSTKNYNKVLKNHRSTLGEIATAHKAMVDAQDALTAAQAPAITNAQLLSDAEDNVTTAQIAVDSSSVDAEASTKALNLALAKGTETDPAVIAAKQGVADANQNIAIATDSATKATDDLKIATAGDTEWAAKVSKARGDVRDATNGIKDAQWQAVDAGIALKNKTDEQKDAFDKWGGAIDGVKAKLTELKKEHPELAAGLGPIFDSIAQMISSAVVVVPGTNNQSLTAGDIRGKGGMNRAAMGGIFKAKPGGHVVNLAEAGQDEAVIPLSMLKTADGSGTTINIVVNGAMDPQAVGRQLDDILSRYNRGGTANFLNN